MDDYGLCAATKTGLQMFDQGQRQTGRTTRMLERVTDDDQIVCAYAIQAGKIAHRLSAMGKKTRVVVIPIQLPISPIEIPRISGQTFFDHEWEYLYLMAVIKEAEAELQSFHRVLHRENVDTRINNLARDGGRP